MILSGECGAFSEELRACLVKISDMLPNLSAYDSIMQPNLYDTGIHDHIRKYEELTETVSLMQSLQAEREKNAFLSTALGQPVFTYRAEPEVFTVSDSVATALNTQAVFIDPFHNDVFCEQLDAECLRALWYLAMETSFEAPDFSLSRNCTLLGKETEMHFVCRSIWVSDPPVLYGFIGRAEKRKGE
jgi:hypothetical protein